MLSALLATAAVSSKYVVSRVAKKFGSSGNLVRVTQLTATHDATLLREPLWRLPEFQMLEERGMQIDRQMSKFCTPCRPAAQPSVAIVSPHSGVRSVRLRFMRQPPHPAFRGLLPKSARVEQRLRVWKPMRCP